MRKGRERSKCDCIKLFCEIVNNVTICSVLYEIKMENQKKKQKKIFFVEFLSRIGKKHTFWQWEWGRISAPNSGDQEP